MTSVDVKSNNNIHFNLGHEAAKRMQKVDDMKYFLNIGSALCKHLPEMTR